MSYQFSNWKYATADNSRIDVTVTSGGNAFPFTYAGPDDGAVAAAVAAYLAEHSPAIAAYSGPALSTVRADLAARVDADAEQERLRYITPGAGMAMTYRDKFDQAQAVDQMGEAAANTLTGEERIAQFPVLAASVGIEAETLWACAQLVIEKYEQFAMIANGIERTRLAAKKSISDASDAATARAVYEAITWPSSS